MKRYLLGILTVIVTTVSSFASGAEMIPAVDLYQDGSVAARSGKPIVTLISASDCPYCEVLKESVFIGMDKDDRIILREINIDSGLELIDFNGDITDHRRFAAQQGSVFTPTVLFLDGSGEALTEPIIGVTNVDFYPFYLEKRIEQSRRELSHRRR